MTTSRSSPVDPSLTVGLVDPSDPEPTQEWLTDFAAAKRGGLAVEVPWDRPKGPRHIYVYGLSTRATGGGFAAHLREKGHVQPTVFVAGGTPTNHSEQAPSTYAEARVADLRFEAVQNVAQGSTGSERSVENRRLATWLGTNAETGIAASTRDEDLEQELMELVFDRLFWPAIKFAVGDEADAIRAALRQWVSLNLRADGALPTLRVGRTAYGLLPLFHDATDLSLFEQRISRSVQRISARLAPLAPSPDLSPDEVLGALARTAHPATWGQRRWNEDSDEPLLDRIQRDIDSLPNRRGSPSAAVWDQSFGPFIDRVQGIVDWAKAEEGPRPAGIARPIDATRRLDPDAEQRDLTADARRWMGRAAALCRSRHVPTIWTRFDGWWTTRGVAARQRAVAAAKYKPAGTNASARAANQRRAGTYLARLTGLGARYRQWEVWEDKVGLMQRLVSELNRAYYRDGTRVDDVLDALAAAGRSTREPGPIAFHRPGAAVGPTGRPSIDDEAGWWTRVPEGETGEPLLQKIAGEAVANRLIDAHGEEAVTWALRGAVGALTYRVDAWTSALANRELTEFRILQRRQSVKSGTARVGAYGLLLDFPDRGQTPPSSQGHVLAPSMAHGATAAVLRAGWLAHDPDEEGQPMAVRLSGRRTQRAQAWLAAVRAGQHMTLAVGRACEKALVDAGQADQLSTLRRRVSGRTDQVVDGLAALSVIEELPAPIASALASVADELDAVEDLLRAEGVHQLLRRSPERAQVALDALVVGLSHPPEQFDVLDAPGVATTERIRVVVAQGAAPAPVDRPRASAHPALNALFASFLGDLDELPIILQGEPPLRRTIGELGLCALDAVVEGEAGLALRVAASFGLAAVPDWAEIDDTDWRLALGDLSAFLRVLRAAGPSPDPTEIGRRARPLAQSWLSAAASDASGLGAALLDWEPTAPHAHRLELAGLAGSAEHAQFVAAIAQKAGDVQALLASDDPDAPVALLGKLTGLPVVGEHAAPPSWTRRDDPVPLEIFSRVRPNVERFHLAAWTCEACPELPTPPKPAWFDADGESALVIGVPEGRWVEWQLDAWEEAVPSAESTLGLAVHADAPAAMPPAALVFAPAPTSGWTDESLGHVLSLLVLRMKARGIGPAELAEDDLFGLEPGLAPTLLWEAP